MPPICATASLRGQFSTGLDSGDIDELTGRMQKGPSTMLAAPRRIGKTTVCAAVCEELKEEGVLVVQVHVPEQPDSRELLQLIIDACNRISPKGGVARRCTIAVGPGGNRPSRSESAVHGKRRANVIQRAARDHRFPLPHDPSPASSTRSPPRCPVIDSPRRFEIDRPNVLLLFAPLAAHSFTSRCTVYKRIRGETASRPRRPLASRTPGPALPFQGR